MPDDRPSCHWIFNRLAGHNSAEFLIFGNPETPEVLTKEEIEDRLRRMPQHGSLSACDAASQIALAQKMQFEAALNLMNTNPQLA